MIVAAAQAETIEKHQYTYPFAYTSLSGLR